MFTYLGLHFSTWHWILWPLKFLIRVDVQPRGITPEKFGDICRNKNIIFVIPRPYLIDIFVFNIFLKSMGVPRLKFHAAKGKIRPFSLMAMRPAALSFLPENKSDRFSGPMANILKNGQLLNETLLYPVSVFFGRTCQQEDRNFILKTILPDDGTSNIFNKILLLIVHGGFVNLHLSKTIDLSSDLDVSPEDRAKKIRRQLLIDFSRERASALGPNLYDFQSVSNWIFKEPENEKTPKTDVIKYDKKALHYLSEIASKYNYTTIRALDALLDIVWNRIFKGVRVRNFDKIAEVAKTGQILWMPCHRSHLDYMLLSYMLFKRGYAAPHIAAGINLNFFPAGAIVRRAGGFFLRRSIAGNKQYSHIFSKYVDFLMHNSFSIEFFHEGGRSRIGKLLQPKLGMTSFSIGSILRRKATNAFVLPLYFSYDKVMEDKTYADELSGAKKQKETAWQAIKALRHLSGKYGYVDISLGRPIHVGEHWTKYLATNNAVEPDTIDMRDPLIQSFMRSLGRAVNQEINAAAVASSTALLCACALGMESESFSSTSLESQITVLNNLYLHIGRSLGLSTSTGLETEVFQELPQMANNSEVTKAVTAAECVQMSLGWKFLDFDGSNYSRHPNANLWWYRGTIFHMIAMPGIVSNILQNQIRPTAASVATQLFYVRKLWDEELYWRDENSNEQIVEATLQAFVNDGFVSIDSDGTIRIQNQEQMRFLARLVQPEIELYRVQMAVCLVLEQKKGKFMRDELLRHSVATHRAAFLRGAATTPAHLSKVFENRTFDMLFKARFFVPHDNLGLSISSTALWEVSDFFKCNSWKQFVTI